MSSGGGGSGGQGAGPGLGLYSGLSPTILHLPFPTLLSSPRTCPRAREEALPSLEKSTVQWGGHWVLRSSEGAGAGREHPTGGQRAQGQVPNSPECGDGAKNLSPGNQGVSLCKLLSPSRCEGVTKVRQVSAQTPPHPHPLSPPSLSDGPEHSWPHPPHLPRKSPLQPRSWLLPAPPLLCFVGGGH